MFFQEILNTEGNYLSMNRNTRKASLLENENGFALSASTLIFFMIMSVFAYYLARFTVTSRKTSANFIQNSRTLNLSQTGLEIGLIEMKNGRYKSLNGLVGNLNNGEYNISLDETYDENDNELSYTHQSMLSSEGSIGSLKSRSRLIVSSYPNAYNLAFYGANSSGSNLNALGVIDGDIFFAGQVASVNQSQESAFYTPTGFNGIALSEQEIPFPFGDTDYFETLLSDAPGYSSGKITSEVGGLNPVPFPHGYSLQQGSQHYEKIGGADLWSTDHAFGTAYTVDDDYTGPGNKHSKIIAVKKGTTLNMRVTGYAGGNYREYIKAYYSTNGSSWSTWHDFGVQTFRNWHSETASKTVTLEPGNYLLAFSLNYYSPTTAPNSRQTYKTSVTYTMHVYESETETIDNGLMANKTINLNSTGEIQINGPSISNNVLSFTDIMTFENCNIIGTGKIVNDRSIKMKNTTVGGGIEIITSDSLITDGTNMGTSVTSIAQSVIVYASTLMELYDSSLHGVIISIGNETCLLNANHFGVIHSRAPLLKLQGNTNVIGSVVSLHGIEIEGTSSITKGDLTPIYDNQYGFFPSVLPGSYKEY